jgi:hypothetical protein
MCAVINRCIPAVFDKLVDLKDAVLSSDNKHNLTTSDGTTITGSDLEDGAM